MEINKNTVIEARKKKRKPRKPYNSMTITTGDIGLNIDRFNQAMSTDFEPTGEGTGESGDLCEAKRYVRRYFLKPQRIYASNKADIIKALIDIGDQNCTVYSLNGLADDDKDVNKLTSHDIIYTYDNGILRDKNGIQIMDYSLSIKKEENRKKLANPDPNSKEFKAEYEDRMTAATELEENLDDEAWATCPYEVIGADYNDAGDEFIVSLNHNVKDIEIAAEELIAWVEENYNMHVIDWNTNGSNVFIFELNPDNAFNLDFDDVNAFGEKLTEAMTSTCCICGEELEGGGNNPEPYMSADEGPCCEGCYLKFVMPIAEV